MLIMISGTVVKRLVENTSDASVIVWQKPECHAVITGAAEGLGMQSRATDSGGKAHKRMSEGPTSGRSLDAKGNPWHETDAIIRRNARYGKGSQDNDVERKQMKKRGSRKCTVAKTSKQSVWWPAACGGEYDWRNPHLALVLQGGAQDGAKVYRPYAQACTPSPPLPPHCTRHSSSLHHHHTTHTSATRTPTRPTPTPTPTPTPMSTPTPTPMPTPTHTHTHLRTRTRTRTRTGMTYTPRILHTHMRLHLDRTAPPYPIPEACPSNALMSCLH